VPTSEFLISDPVWYEPLDTVADEATRFSVTRLDPPPGWAREQRGGWVMWQRRGLALPRQGWKIHVSARIDEADDVIRVVRDYCADHAMTFKFLRSRTVFLVRNEKYAARGSSGKLCTIYPRDDAELERTLSELSTALAGYSGPYILSDFRWGNGPLYVRYGGFLPDYCFAPETGNFVPGIHDDHGVVVPDPRSPVFRVPPWAPVPAFLAEAIQASAATPAAELPYRVERALHFSNGGGVYRAVDPRTQQVVVLREARPHAGLDSREDDAVSRLAREETALRQLAGLGVAPALIDGFTCWEHHYLVEEYIEGPLLHHAIVERYPLIHPRPTAQIVARYTRWAMAILDQVEAALQAVHSRGIVYGDLHPRNVIVRPEGRIALIDFEEAFAADEPHGTGLAAPGFAPPWPLTGQAVDDYALNCLRLAFFLPMTALLDLDPGKARQLVRLAADRFRLPDSFTGKLTENFTPPASWNKDRWQSRRRGLRPWPAACEGLPGETSPDWQAWTSSMTAAVVASATPQRQDRLFPGDARQFSEGAVSLAHGAAGVLYALARTGGPVPPEHVDWLERAAARWQPAPPGLFRGLDGVAAVLAMLGRREAGLAVADRARRLHPGIQRLGMQDGLAGVGLSLLYLARVTGEPGLTAAALDAGERLAEALHRDSAPGVVPPAKPGLLEGWSGVAAFFLRLHEECGQEYHLDLAEAAIRRDLASCVITKDGGLQVKDGARRLLYLATGSTGIGIVARQFAQRRPRDDLAAAVGLIRRELSAEFVINPGLFEGRAGLLLAAGRLCTDGRGHRDTSLALHHLRRLSWHAFSHHGRLVFPGDGMRRLSMDLATGTAGILLAIHETFSEPRPQSPGAPETLFPALGAPPSTISRGGEVNGQYPQPAGAGGGLRRS
jgi:predicted Ser/Thr protein kinase